MSSAFFNSLNFSDISTEDIKKFNGKNVDINDTLKIFFDSKNFILFFRTHSSLASVRFKLRALLNIKFIKLRCIKKRNFLVGLHSCKLANRNSISLCEEIFQCANTSGFFLIFQDFNQLVYFENLLLLKFFKGSFFPMYLKNSNQFIFINSVFYKKLRLKIDVFKNNLNIIFGFLPFFYKFHVCYLIFLLAFVWQRKFLAIL